MQFAKRMEQFADGIFTELLAMKTQQEKAGHTVIDLSVGTPNIPPVERIRRALADAALDPKNYVYAIRDTSALQKAAAVWYKRRYGVELDPETQIESLLGSQEGLTHICLSIIDPGETVLVPDPCYPAFSCGPLVADGRLCYMPLKKENGYLIDFDAIDPEDAKKAKLMIVSYPNNPTTAIAPDSFYEKLIAFAKKYDIIVIHDNAYSELRQLPALPRRNRRRRRLQFPEQDVRHGRRARGVLPGQRKGRAHVKDAQVEHGLRHVFADPARGDRSHHGRSKLCQRDVPRV